MKFKKLLILFLPLFFTNCATLTTGPTQDVYFTSNPSKASISIDGIDYGTTPQTIALRRKGKSYSIKISLNGYNTYENQINRKVNGYSWTWGNLIFGGPIGITVDLINGSIYKLTPDQIIAHLNTDITGDIKLDGNSIYFAVSLAPEKDWEQIGQLKKIE